MEAVPGEAKEAHPLTLSSTPCLFSAASPASQVSRPHSSGDFPENRNGPCCQFSLPPWKMPQTLPSSPHISPGGLLGVPPASEESWLGPNPDVYDLVFWIENLFFLQRGPPTPTRSRRNHCCWQSGVSAPQDCLLRFSQGSPSVGVSTGMLAVEDFPPRPR